MDYTTKMEENNGFMMDDITTIYEDVKDQTTEDYFKENKFSIDAFEKKYSLYKGESYVNAIKRVCDFVASVEKTPKLREYWSTRWFDEIYNDWWQPAGSIMQGAGSGRKISMSNCTTLSLGVNRDDEEWDSLESIIKNTSYDVAKCAAYRQGLGVDFSRLRPEGMGLLNSANVSTGAVHWMKFIDQIGYSVGQCLEGDTLIKTDGGDKKIKDIVDSDDEYSALTHKGYKPIVNKFSNGNKEIYRLRMEDGEFLDVTEDHNVVVFDSSDEKFKMVLVKDINFETDKLVKLVE